MDAPLLAPPAVAPAEDQWVFRSRNPDAFFRHDRIGVTFKHAQYVTSDPREAAFLLGVEADSHGREVQCLMRPRPPLAAPPAEHAPTADRQRRTRRKGAN